MSEQKPEVKIVSAEVVADNPDAIELALDVRIGKLEAEEAEQAKGLREVLLRMIHLQDASLKHSAALGLFLAVGFFVASRALGA